MSVWNSSISVLHRLLWSLFAVVVVLPTFAGAKTYYASPQGTGTACSGVAPCRIRTFWSKAKPGDTLLLRTGTYRGEQSRIQPPRGLNGQPGKYITIQAEHDGGVLLLNPIRLSGNYFRVVGVDVRGDRFSAVSLLGDNNILRRVVGMGHPKNIESGLTLFKGHNNLVEDCAFFGPARKQVQPSSFDRHQNNTVRRLWARWEHRNPSGSYPTNGVELGYGQGGMLYENIVVTWNQHTSVRRGRVADPEGMIQAFTSHNSRLFGSIVYTHAGDLYRPRRGIFAIHSQLTNFTARDLLAYIHLDVNRGSSRATPVPLAFENGVSTAPPRDHGTASLTNAIGIGGGGNRIDSHWQAKNVRWFPTVRAAGNVWTRLPGICKRVVGGKITNQGLWPWPMDDRIVRAHKRAIHGPNGDQPYTAPKELRTVTAQMELAFGKIPAQCRSNSPASPPPPDAPAPPVEPTTVPSPAPPPRTNPSPAPNIPKASLSIVSQSSQEFRADAERAIDGNRRTTWVTRYRRGIDPLPHHVTIDLAASKPVVGLEYTPRQDGRTEGNIKTYRIYVHDTPGQRGSPVAVGNWGQSRRIKRRDFPMERGRYVTLEALDTGGGSGITNAAEILVLIQP